MIEASTILGPFFAISPLQTGVTSNYFSSPKTRDRAYIANSQRALRLTLATHQADLLDIVNNIVKSGEEPRSKMLDWYALCVNTNHKRRAMQVDQRTVSSDGFMINVTTSLDQLCEVGDFRAFIPLLEAFPKVKHADAASRWPLLPCLTARSNANSESNSHSWTLHSLKSTGSMSII